MSAEKDQVEEQLERIRGLAVSLGLPERFFELLLREDDWSFVIKLHALLEAALAALLRDAIGRPEAEGFLARLPMSDAAAGKVELAKALGVLDKPYRRYLKKLSELRNHLVHDPNRIGIYLRQHFKQLSEDARRSAAQAFAVGFRADPGWRLAEFENNPKFAIWISALCLLSLFTVHHDLFDIDRRMTALAIKFIDGLPDG